MKSKLPVVIMDRISKIPGIGTTAMEKNVKKGKMVVNKAWKTSLLFDHFTINSWIYESI